MITLSTFFGYMNCSYEQNYAKKFLLILLNISSFIDFYDTLMLNAFFFQNGNNGFIKSCHHAYYRLSNKRYLSL